jgi:predicted RNA-binding Zn-ribbon protein involved in translation (DUF1610 family)
MLMETELPAQTLNCTQCGGELHPDEGQIFLACPFCGAAVYLDKSRVVFHWYIAPTLDEAKARASLARWMAGSQTVKDLDKKSRVTEAAFEYFPLWYFKQRLPDKREEIWLQPAAATSVSEIRHLNLPAGDLRKYDSGLDSQAHPPNVPLQAALRWLEAEQVPQSQVAEQALVHIPIYTFKYVFQGVPYTALVEAATGGVVANIYPAKAEVPFRLIGCMTASIFLCLGLLPIFGAATGGAEGTGLGLLGCIGVGIVVAPVAFGLALWVAAKV